MIPASRDNASRSTADLHGRRTIPRGTVAGNPVKIGNNKAIVHYCLILPPRGIIYFNTYHPVPEELHRALSLTLLAVTFVAMCPLTTVFSFELAHHCAKFHVHLLRYIVCNKTALLAEM